MGDGTKTLTTPAGVGVVWRERLVQSAVRTTALEKGMMIVTTDVAVSDKERTNNPCEDLLGPMLAGPVLAVLFSRSAHQWEEGIKPVSTEENKPGPHCKPLAPAFSGVTGPVI